MRLLTAGLLVVGLAALHAQEPAATKPAADDKSFDAIKKEYDEAHKNFMEEKRKESEVAQKAAQDKLKAAKKAVEDAKTDEEKKAAQAKLKAASGFPAMKMVSRTDGPGEKFAPRFLAFAVNNPKDPSAVESFNMALLTSGGPKGKGGVWTGVVKALRADHVGNPELKGGVRLFRMLAGAHDPAANDFLREVIAKNPDRRAQGRACQALAQGLARAPDPKARKEAEELARTVREKYDDVCPDLSIGKPAPEVVSKGLDGKEVRLSALKGRVVVLDIWATWCGPCRAMIPHEREMVERLKDKPFTLVSISTDEEKETLTKFLEKEKMPWTHWWNGHDGGIVEDWDVQAYPTIYVLDAKGVIRHKGLRGEKLEEAVNALLKEAAGGPN